MKQINGRFKKIEGIIDIYEEACENADEQFQSIYTEAVNLTNKLGTRKQRKSQNNIPPEAFKQ